MSVAEVLFSFYGRIGRGVYAAGLGGLIAATLLAMGIVFSLPRHSGAAEAVLAVMMIGTTWTKLALGVKRLRDMNLSPWVILVLVIPIVGLIRGDAGRHCESG